MGTAKAMKGLDRFFFYFYKSSTDAISKINTYDSNCLKKAEQFLIRLFFK
jgi:hypothetical protein